MGTVKKFIRIVPFLFFCLVITFVAGCSGKKDAEVRRDIDFTVCDSTRMPDELRTIIDEKKAKPFKLSYVSGEYLYIAVGYGEKSRANYGVVVSDLFLTENAIYICADLTTSDSTATDAKKAYGDASMYPYIVIKCEKIDLPVVFDVD